MLVGDKLSHAAASEAYVLLSSYVREEGKLGTHYDKNRITEFVRFLAEILQHPENFNTIQVQKIENDLPEHDGLGLA